MISRRTARIAGTIWKTPENDRQDWRDQNREDWQDHRKDAWDYRADRADEIWDNCRRFL